MGGGPPAVQQTALRQQHRAAAYGGDAPGVGRGKTQPVDNGGTFLLVLPSAGDDDGIERFARIHFVKAVVGKQIQPGLTVDHLVGLGSGEGNAVARALSPLRVQSVGLHQNVGNTGGFKEHAAIGDDNQYFLHVLKSKSLTK